jgi:hypothetical protein
VTDFGAVNIDGDQDNFLPDSLCFVEDGIVFLMQGQFDYVFGFSLGNGQLTAVEVPGVDEDGGFYIPDNDKARAYMTEAQQSAQFAFATDEPDSVYNHAAGPDVLAFVAGDNVLTEELTDLSTQARDGWGQIGNDIKDVFTLELVATGNGLDLSQATLTNQTENSTWVAGDFLTPGRLGEGLDFMAVSPDGEYVAVVRDFDTGSYKYWYSYSNIYYYQVNGTFGAPSTYPYSTSSTPGYGYGPYGINDDLLLISVQGDDLDPTTSGKAGNQHILYMGSHSFSNQTSSAPNSGPTSSNTSGWANYLALPTNVSHTNNTFNAAHRRLCGLKFSNDSRSLIVNYAGNQSYSPKYMRDGYGLNAYYEYRASNNYYYYYYTYTMQQLCRIQFKDSDGDIIRAGLINTNASNILRGLADIGPIGDTSAPFGDISYQYGTTLKNAQQFQTTFQSENGSFLYVVTDRYYSSVKLVGFNISSSTINNHTPFVPFNVHDDDTSLPQIQCNSYGYGSRFCAVPGSGIVCFVGADSSNNLKQDTDLDVYAFDANTGSDAVVLSSNVTPGTLNAINHMYLSTNGNVLAFQRCPWAGSSSTSSTGSGYDRTTLQGNNDLCLVTNVRAAVEDGDTPNCFVLSGGASHGHSVAFVGETPSDPTGVPLQIWFSSTDAGGNGSWVQRTLKSALLEAGASIMEEDDTESYYEVMAGGRLVGDDPSTGK